MNRQFALRFLTLALTLWTQPLAWGGDERVLRYLLLDTEAGRTIATRVAGFELESASAAELRQFREGLAQPERAQFKKTFEDRLSRLEKELETKVAAKDRGAAGELSALEKAYADEFIEQALRIPDGCDWQCLKLVEMPKKVGYSIKREMFLKGAPRAEIDFYRDAMPTSVWGGELDTRVAELAKRWPKAVTVVEDVKFQYKPETGPSRTRSRRVLLISRKSVPKARQTEFMRDYVDAVAPGTVSFPLEEAEGHLYTRIGSKKVDFINRVDVNDFDYPNTAVLEPLVALSDAEQLRLATYVNEAVSEVSKVVGGFNMNGATHARTRGRLTDNRSTVRGERHNCTSWVCTAPIGDRRQQLLKLIGATPEIEVHTNPGWWNMFLVGGATKERVPYVVYWSNSPNLKVAEKRVSDALKNWDFGAH